MNELVNIKLKSILRETAHLARPREYREFTYILVRYISRSATRFVLSFPTVSPLAYALSSEDAEAPRFPANFENTQLTVPYDI